MIAFNFLVESIFFSFERALHAKSHNAMGIVKVAYEGAMLVFTHLVCFGYSQIQKFRM